MFGIYKKAIQIPFMSLLIRLDLKEVEESFLQMRSFQLALESAIIMQSLNIWR